VAGVVLAGVQLPEAVHAPEATFQVYVVCADAAALITNRQNAAARIKPSGFRNLWIANRDRVSRCAQRVCGASWLGMAGIIFFSLAWRGCNTKTSNVL